MPLRTLPYRRVRTAATRAVVALTAAVPTIVSTVLVTTLASAWLPLGVAFAQDVDIVVPGPGGASASPLATLARLGLALVVVLVVFWACAHAMRRLQRVGEAGGGGLRVVGGLSLGQRERLVVVEAGGEQLLLGVSPGRIERLHVLDSPLGATSDTVGGRSVAGAINATSESGTTSPRGAAAPADFRAKLLAAMQRRVPS